MVLGHREVLQPRTSRKTSALKACSRLSARSGRTRWSASKVLVLTATNVARNQDRSALCNLAMLKLKVTTNFSFTEMPSRSWTTWISKRPLSRFLSSMCALTTSLARPTYRSWSASRSSRVSSSKTIIFIASSKSASSKPWLVSWACQSSEMKFQILSCYVLS